MKFINELHLRKIDSGTWVLTQPFFVNHALRGIKVELGFVTDLATVPKWIRWLLPPDGEYKESAVIHDWLLMKMYQGNPHITRAIASSTFRDSLVYQGIAPWKIITLYVGVRLLDFYKAAKKWWNIKRYWRFP